MKKLIRALLLTAITTTLLSAPCFANNVSVKDVTTKIESLQASSPIITKPKDKVYLTTNDSVVISGTGKEKDIVSITVYTKSGSEYTLISDDSLEIGPLGVFTTELSLKYAGKTPKSMQISGETYVYLKIVRGTTVIDDARIIKYTSDEKLQDSLSALKTGGALKTVGH
ncbi:MAG: hypothetical protein ACRDA4_04320 [Filifactoraceae bacterium]